MPKFTIFIRDLTNKTFLVCIYYKLMIMNKEETIDKIKGIDNIYKYSIKGGTAMFNREYPELLNSINEHTKEMFCSLNLE